MQPYLSIRPFVGFRLTGGRLYIKNMKNGAVYELNGPSACLWLQFNGKNTESVAIQKCLLRSKVRDRRFPSKAKKLIDDMVRADLIYRTSNRQADPRAPDMDIFLKNLGQKKQAPTVRIKRDIRKGDVEAIKMAKLKFLGLQAKRAKLMLKRIRSLRHNHVFMCDLQFPLKDTVVGFGAGLTAEQAATSAIGEAVERFFSIHTDNKADFMAKSYKEMKKSAHPVFNINKLRFFDADQEAAKNGEVQNFPTNEKLDWAFFESGNDSKKQVLFPLELNLGFSKKNPQRYLGETTTNGCAGGPDPETAKLGAALELCERDAFLFYWRTRNTPPKIDLSTVDESIKKVLASMGPLRNRLTLFYLKTDLAAATILAVIRSERPPYFCCAAASHLDVTIATRKALLEIMYVYGGIPSLKFNDETLYGRYLDNSIWDFTDRCEYYSRSPATKAYDFLFSKGPKYSMKRIPTVRLKSTKDYLNRLLDDFKKQNIEVYFRNNTPTSFNRLGIWVYRAFSPQLLDLDANHRFRRLGYKRYYTLAQRLKLKNRPSALRQLSLWPHPLP